MLAGQCALITGCAAPRGIGRPTARLLASEGANVLVSDQPGLHPLDSGPRERMDLLDEVVSEITAADGQAKALVLDVTKPEDIAAAIDVAQGFGGVDILVNNAGTVTGAGPFMNSTPAQWEVSFQVNLLGPMRLA